MVAPIAKISGAVSFGVDELPITPVAIKALFPISNAPAVRIPPVIAGMSIFKFVPDISLLHVYVWRDASLSWRCLFYLNGSSWLLNPGEWTWSSPLQACPCQLSFYRAERNIGINTLLVRSVGQSARVGKEHSAVCLEGRTGNPIGQTLIGFQSEQAFTQ